MSTAEGCDVSVLEFHQLHTFETIEHLLMLRFRISRKETLAEAGEYHFIDGDRELLVELVVLGEIPHSDFLGFLPIFIISDSSFCWLHQAQDEAHEGGLATTVWSDDAKIIVLINGEIDVVEHLFAVVSGG